MRQAVVLAVLLSVALPVLAQSRHKLDNVRSEEQRSAADAHSFMELFGKLERDWGLAAEEKNQKSLDEIVADEFIERDASDPENTITKTKWMQKRLSDYNLDPLQIRSMTIRVFLGNAVVSFVQRQKGTQNVASGSTEYFIVDVWVANHGKWQVASRFSSVISRTGLDRP